VKQEFLWQDEDMIFEGDREFSAELRNVWTKLRDARWLVQCIPDSSPGEAGEMDRATCSVRPGFAFVRGSLDVVLELQEVVEGRSLRFLITSKGIGSSADVETTLTFASHESGTRVHWKAEIKRLGGLLKAVPAGLIRGAAQKVIEDVWTSVAERMK
jgi:carbon monoxide dehydrogenase subunit G